MYCWKLKKVLDYEDGIDTFHICVDREIADSIIFEIEKVKDEIELPLNSFPIGNPKHLDIGLQEHNENYKEEIIEFKALKIKINDSFKEITVSFIDDIARIELSKDKLKVLLSAIRKSKRFAYIYDNYLDVENANPDSNKVKSQLIIWAGMDGDVVYC